MSKQILIDRFFEALTSGNREAAREMVDECVATEAPAETILERLFWPTLDMIQTLYRNDQLSVISHHYATRLMRMLCDQMQLRLERAEPTGQRVLLVSGPDEPDELQGQIAADLLEADGYEVYFAGGGIANDEIVDQVGHLGPALLVMFGSSPKDLPFIRTLIDLLRDQGTCPDTQIVVGGGVFNRAEGLAEEIGADLWEESPLKMIKAIRKHGDRRAVPEQRTVGRRRRSPRAKSAAA
ncbi:MAG: B12-binding domain-containing protein [Phycisphaerae bacterium]|nr:B12-binding domain-containing protein [Phycisphaerae bacterium]